MNARLILALLAMAGLAFSALAAPTPLPPPRIYPIALATGEHSNPGRETAVVFSSTVVAPATTHLRVHFKSYHLGVGSYVTLTSLKDGQTHKLDRAGMTNWFQTSALLNGDQVQLELYAAPGDTAVHAEVDHLVLDCGCIAAREDEPEGLMEDGRLESLCGEDNRVASSDKRVGRTSSGCTGWLIANGAVLTAGHCVPNGAIFMVNIPPSRPDGTLMASAVEDQYPIVPNSETVLWHQNGTPLDASDDIDFALFRLNPDILGRRAHERVGFFRVTTAVPSPTARIRITGVGTDNSPPGSTGGLNAQNQTLQTSTGGFSGQRDMGPAGPVRILRHFYTVDTTGGNSGSPVIWDDTGFAIGIHTSAGCGANGGGANSATAFSQVNLRAAVENFAGPNTRYLDTVTYPGSPTDAGSMFAPDHNLQAAYNRAVHGGVVSIVAGNYPRSKSGNTGTFGNNGKWIRLEAPVGPVTIGQ